MPLAPPATGLNAAEIPQWDLRAMEHGTTDGLRRIIAAVAAGAGEGVAALRSAGIGVELEVYTIEIDVDSDGPDPVASVRMVWRGTGP